MEEKEKINRMKTKRTNSAQSNQKQNGKKRVKVNGVFENILPDSLFVVELTL